MKKNNKKGFTLAELLIVVAIIGILVAVSIPIFTAQLNKAKMATDEANARSIYAQLVADYMDNETIDGGSMPITFTAGETTTFGGNSFKWSDKLTAGSASLGTDGPIVVITSNGTTFTFPGASAVGSGS
jgi:type IV pilus assembly protein PilA